MNVLVACEESGKVTDALVAVGVDAYSCDILPTSGNHPDRHFQRDVRELLWYRGNSWDMVIAFPPCDDLAVSGARWFKEKQADGRQQKSIEFFLMFTRLTCKWAIENPIGIMSTQYRKPDQIIQPWMFGHGETKATCLWLNGLPKLIPTDIVPGREQKVWRMPPSDHRKADRARTYLGIAEAMAQRWSKL